MATTSVKVLRWKQKILEHILFQFQSQNLSILLLMKTKIVISDLKTVVIDDMYRNSQENNIVSVI